MEKPLAPQRWPYPLPVKKGETVHWCACGRSTNQPWCDGSHQGTGINPVSFTAEKDGIVFFCGCKRSKKGMVCDGSHSKIRD